MYVRMRKRKLEAILLILTQGMNYVVFFFFQKDELYIAMVGSSFALTNMSTFFRRWRWNSETAAGGSQPIYPFW